MSSFENEYVSMNPHPVTTPSWVKSERLEYCEPYKAPAHRSRVAKFFASLGFNR